MLPTAVTTFIAPPPDSFGESSQEVHDDLSVQHPPEQKLNETDDEGHDEAPSLTAAPIN